MDFILLTVNGKDISGASHAETVSAFESAVLEGEGGPIQVQVMPKSTLTPPHNNQDVHTSSSSQTGEQNNNYNSLMVLKESCQLSNSCWPVPPVLGSSSDLGIRTLDPTPEPLAAAADYLGLEEDEDGNILIPSLDYEEVLLVRPEGGERLGLTLCYETDAEDGLTDIFVDDIHPDGLAAADGRLRLGDQIIQINGEDIKTKPQAQEIFIQSRGDISLLVARPPSHFHHSSFNLEEEGFVDELDCLEAADQEALGQDDIDHDIDEELEDNQPLDDSVFVDTDILTASTPQLQNSKQSEHHYQNTGGGQEQQSSPTSKQNGSNRSSLASGDSGVPSASTTGGATNSGVINATKETSSTTSECYLGTSSISSQGGVAMNPEVNKPVVNPTCDHQQNTTLSNFSTGSNSFSSSHSTKSRSSGSKNLNNYDGGYSVGEDEFCFIMNTKNNDPAAAKLQQQQSSEEVSSKESEELAYVEKKLQDIRVDLKSTVGGGAPEGFKLMSSSICFAEPIYETIPEMSEPESHDQVYSLPHDSMLDASLPPQDHHEKVQQGNKEAPSSSSHMSKKPPAILSNKKSPTKESKLTKLGFPLNKLIRSTSGGVGKSSTDKKDKLESQPKASQPGEERTEKLREVEQWLKSSLTSCSDPPAGQQQQNTTLTPLISPPTRFRHSGSKKIQDPNSAVPQQVKHSTSLTFTQDQGASLNSVIIPSLPQVQRRVVHQPKGKMPLKGTMPRPTSFHEHQSRQLSVSSAASNNSHNSRKTPDIAYTDYNNLENTMRIQQEMLRKSLSNERKSPSQKASNHEQYRMQQEQAALMQRHGHSMAISGLQPASISNSQPVKSPSLSGGGREVSAVGNSSSGQRTVPAVFHPPPPPSESNYCVPEDQTAAPLAQPKVVKVGSHTPASPTAVNPSPMVLTTFKTTQDVHEGPKLPPTATTPSDASGQWEWRVKVRKDGTRYVTRRPAASKAKFLRERAQRVTEERSSGMTTDDDAVSEFKLGRYWNRNERKAQLEHAREQKRQRQIAVLNSKLKACTAAAASDGSSSHCSLSPGSTAQLAKVPTSRPVHVSGNPNGEDNNICDSLKMMPSSKVAPAAGNSGEIGDSSAAMKQVRPQSTEPVVLSVATV